MKDTRRKGNYDAGEEEEEAEEGPAACSESEPFMALLSRSIDCSLPLPLPFVGTALGEMGRQAEADRKSTVG